LIKADGLDRRAARTVTWLAASFVSYLVAAGVTLLVVAWITGPLPDVEAGTLGHGIVLAVWVVVWSAVTAAAVFILAFALFKHRPRLPLPTTVLAALLTVAAAGVQLALHEWSRSHFGSYDSEYLGVANLYVPALVFGATVCVGAGIALDRWRRAQQHH
jgi:hypothetical protein